MKKISIVLIISLLFLALFVGLLTVGAENDDPLVTLSYINETVIPKIKEEVKTSILAILDEREAEKEEIIPEPETPAVSPEDLDSLKFTVVLLEDGKKLMASGAETSSTEIILRAGKVSAVSPFHDQGVADLTSSTELYNNDPLVKNNYCIIPRGSDGRGIVAVDGNAYILVRGEYEIVQ